MNKEINIDLRRCLKAILKKWWLVAIVGAGCYLTAFLITTLFPREDEYTAETTVYSITASANSTLSIYSDIITSYKVCVQAADSLNIPNIDAKEIRKMLSVNDYTRSLVLGIRATSSDGKLAIRVANAVSEAFVKEVNNIITNDSLRLLDEATLAEISYNKRVEQLKLRVIAALAGIVILCIWITLREMFTKKIYNLADMKLDGDIDVIGIIPVFDKKMKGEK